MADENNAVSRRVMIGTLVGGATVATAVAQTKLRSGGNIGEAFQSAFTSPFFSLARADHKAWAAEVGQTLQVTGGPALQIAGVETFASYGVRNSDLIRPRAFAVNFNIIGSGRISTDTVYRVSHARYGSFDLFLLASPDVPGFAQAMFN